MFVKGYLQVVVAAVAAAKPVAGDPNTVVFTRNTQSDFERLRDWLETVAGTNQTLTEVPSATQILTQRNGGRRGRVSTFDLSVVDLEVVGESNYRAAFAQLFLMAGKPLGGVIWRDAELVAEQANPHDRNAVAVVIDGHKVGHVPAELAPTIQPTVLRAAKRHESTHVAARIWAIYEDATWSARVTLSPSGDPEPEWRYVDEAHWPGRMSPDGTERLTDAGLRRQLEAHYAARLVRGRDFDDYRPDIAQARVDQDNALALSVLDDCIDAAERAAAVLLARPASWPTEQAAIVYRSLKDYDAEVAVLERFVAACPDNMATKSVQTRLVRARQLAGRVGDVVDSASCHDAPAEITRLPDQLPVVDVRIPFAAELSYEKDHIDAIRAVLGDANIQPGTALHSAAVLRERPHRPRSRGIVDAFIDGMLVGSVSAIEADDIREVIRREQHAGKDCRIRCRVYLSPDARPNARITLGRYEDVVAREDETESAARARQEDTELAALRTQRLAAGGEEAADQRRRLVRGKDYVEWSSTIKELKREKRDDAALQLALECVDAAERDAKFHAREPAPAYTEQAAMLYRKSGNVSAEVRILERYQQACPTGRGSSAIAERLVKARARL
nr:HIRAN domain-containing protein [Gordonia liuliyuniae]